MFHKECTKCKVRLLLHEFHKHVGGRYGRQSVCKVCTKIYASERRRKDPQKTADRERASQIKYRYGMTMSDYDSMLERQGGCAICGTTDPRGAGQFHIDHCHETGKVRALLCHLCNTGLGKFKDSPELLGKATQYLNTHNNKH